MSDSSTSSGAAQGGTEELPLWKAALAWCDPALVRDLRDAFTEYTQAYGFRPRENPFPSRFELNASADLLLAEMAGAIQPATSAPDIQWRGAAHAVTQDFRRRLAAGEVELDGLRVKPQLEMSRSHIPPAWSELIELEWAKETIRAWDTEFVQVRGRRGSTPRAQAAEPQAFVAPRRRSPTRAKGRPPFPIDKLVRIAAERHEARKPTNKEDATELLKIFRERHPNIQPPAHRTVSDHVAEIYTKAAEAERPVKPQK
jgi:hypothetical protein